MSVSVSSVNRALRILHRAFDLALRSSLALESFVDGLIEPLSTGQLLSSSPLNETDYQHDDGNHQYDVNEPSHRVTGHQPEDPQNYQYHRNRPKHFYSPFK